MREPNANILNRRRRLSHNRADVADRLRFLRRNGMKIRTIWSGGTWAVLERNGDGPMDLVSTINSRHDGVFVHSLKYDVEAARKS